MKSALVAIIAVGASANEYESLGQGQCRDAAGNEVSYYYSYHEGLGANCQSVCDADDECVAFHGSVKQDICIFYAPSRSSAPDRHPIDLTDSQKFPTWGWVDLSHDSVTKAVDWYADECGHCMLKKAVTADAILTVGAKANVANEYESLGQGTCSDAAGNEVSNYYSYYEGLGANCQSVCDADDECVAFHGYVKRDICIFYAPSRSSAPDGHPTWGWADLSHDSVTKAVNSGSRYADEGGHCMLKKAVTADAILTVGAKANVANEYESLGQGTCSDSAGQEVSKYYSYFEGLGATCQSVCDADDECKAFSGFVERDICILYAPSRSSAPDGHPTWGWADLSHDSVTKAVHAGSYAKTPDCMLKKAATASEFLV